MQVVSSGKYCTVHGIEKTYWNKNPKVAAGGTWKCSLCTIEHQRRYDGVHREERLERKKQYYAAHHEEAKERRRREYAADPEKHRERSRKYREAHPNERAEYNRQYRAANMKAQRERAWRKQGIEGLTYEYYQELATHCRICGATDKLVADHDQDTHQFRGVLCDICNLGIGLFKHNPQYLRCAELYLGGQPCW